MTERSGYFVIVPVAAAEDSRLSPAAFRVLALLSSYADRDGWCWPSQKTLAERLGHTRQAVQQHITQLEALGYLKSERRFGPTGIETSKKYRLVYDELGGKPSLHRGQAQLAPGGQAQLARSDPDLNGSNERETDPARAKSETEPLTVQQGTLATKLRRRVVSEIYGARGDAPRAADFGEDVIRAGATEEDIDSAIRATLDKGIFGHRGASYFLAVARGLIADRREGRNADNGRGGGGSTAARGPDSGAPRRRGVGSGNSRGTGLPRGTEGDPRYDYDRPVPTARRLPEAP